MRHHPAICRRDCVSLSPQFPSLMNNIHVRLIAQQLNISERQVVATIRLLDEGATIPFIARYRKEATGELDEVEVADISQSAKRLDELEKRRATILSSIEEQGKLTDDLRRRIEGTYDATELEDLYLPYKRKRKTRAGVARERGLEPLALALLAQQNHQLEQMASAYLTDEVPTIEAALDGARDIIAELVSEDETARQKVRVAFANAAMVKAKVARGKEEEGAKYRDYFEYNEALAKCPSHRLLAILRAEEEGMLRVIISPDDEPVLATLEHQFVKGRGPASEQVQLAIHDGYQRLLAPGIETEFRHLAKERADKEAIDVFVTNLRQLLLSAPLGQRRVLGIDPGFRTGCKLVCLDESGSLLAYEAIFPHPPQNRELEARETLEHLVDRFQIEAIAIGNGTASRETVAVCRRAHFERPVDIFIVNEAGASIYSASEVAREEFPDQDITVRGAISIGRRLLDPLAELVKIDPKSIGVGQYQHDVNQALLRESLDRTVESCVNSVGINLNTASKHLLTYVSGVGPVLAQNIVSYRSANGPFRSRRDILKVPRLGEKAFEQCAGFLRIRQGAHPLDNTAVHPERYELVAKMAADLGVGLEDLIKRDDLRKRIRLQDYLSEEVGLPTLKDIMAELAKPGLDPRGQAKPFDFGNVQTIEDLRPGMVLPGIVTNVTNFGAFVDIGIKENGLVHISQIANRFVKNPADVLSLNQEVQVKVLEVDIARKRVQLSMKDV